MQARARYHSLRAEYIEKKKREREKEERKKYETKNEHNTDCDMLMRFKKNAINQYFEEEEEEKRRRKKRQRLKRFEFICISH